MHGGGDGARQRRLAGSRRVLEEQVPFGEHAGQRQADDVFLTQEGLADVVRDPRERVREPVSVVFGDFHCCPLLCCGFFDAVVGLVAVEVFVEVSGVRLYEVDTHPPVVPIRFAFPIAVAIRCNRYGCG